MNDPMEKKAVHSWSRLSSAGQSALEEALRVFNPMSKDLTDTETQLVTFLQGLREEGFQATVLSSKDVYGYKSTTANTPPPKTKIPSKPPAVVPSKTQTKNPNGKVSSSTVDLSVKAPKVPSKPPAKKTPNLLLSSFRKTNLKKSKVSGVDFAPGVYPSAYPTMRLSVVLEAIVPASSIEAGLRSRSAVGKTVTKGRSNQSYQCVIRQNSPTANGRILKENNACNTLGVVNGRILVNSPSSRHNGLTQSKPNTKLQVDVIVREDKRQQVGKDKKRKPPDALQDASPHKKIKIFIPLAKKPTLDKDKYDLLKSKVIKVDRASSDEDVRRKAQQILKVNLSPVLRIQPLLFNLS